MAGKPACRSAIRRAFRLSSHWFEAARNAVPGVNYPGRRHRHRWRGCSGVYSRPCLAGPPGPAVRFGTSAAWRLTRSIPQECSACTVADSQVSGRAHLPDCTSRCSWNTWAMGESRLPFCRTTCQLDSMGKPVTSRTDTPCLRISAIEDARNRAIVDGDSG